MRWYSVKQKVQRLLSGAVDANIFPFLWLHGESEDVLREYMGAIYDANLRAVCLESRPHPDFLGDGWWHDLDILLDEARKRSMKVWILDDSHFPTGFANGALRNADPKLCRQFLACAVIEDETIPATAPAWKPGKCEQWLSAQRTFTDDRIISVTKQKDGKTLACYLTRNRGPHRDYINMLDEASCRVLIDTVYEAHYAHYAADFGKTIAGFFSDEPELGNDHLYEYGKRLWELDDLPWSEGLEKALRKRWGEAFERKLPMLWEKNGTEAARARYDYMDELTDAVRRCFSEQVGAWCHNHGVEYIGHLIEDNNQHTRTGSSLGHYFRGLSGQDMAGIDDIGNQVLPQGEWNGRSGPWNDYRDGEFYHYVLGKLGSSLAAIDPKKKGRCMCEVFGNYGWQEGIRLEKYLADHFLVRGVNRFVPHAFSPKAFPDPDCPPHFYAHGHNPQYRHFGALMAYMGKLCTLLSDGRHVAPAAILYNAAAEWTGEYLELQKLAIPLYDEQIDYDILPEDVFSAPKLCKIPEYQIFLVPGAQYLTKAAAEGLILLREKGCAVWFVGRYPDGLCDCEDTPDWSRFPLLKLEELAEKAQGEIAGRVILKPPNNRIRVLHYQNGQDIFFLANEGTKPWRGQLQLPVSGSCCAYDVWNNVLEEVDAKAAEGGTELLIEIVPGKSLCLIFGMDNMPLRKPLCVEGLKKSCWNEGWTRSQCPSIQYPAFENPVRLNLPDRLAEEQPKFSGFVRYEKTLHTKNKPETCILIITDASEGVELFVNGQSLGIQVSAPYCYELDRMLHVGDNRIAIEAATTLERALCEDATCGSGLHGEVFLYTNL